LNSIHIGEMYGCYLQAASNQRLGHTNQASAVNNKKMTSQNCYTEDILIDEVKDLYQSF